MTEVVVQTVPSPGDRLAEEGAGVVRERSSLVPNVAVILGSGLGAVVDGMADSESFAFTDLPGFPAPTVPGHAGRLALGRLEGVAIAAFQGRIHFYEGNDIARCALPVRLAHALGARTLVITAATGGIDRSLTPGSIVVGTDHLNMIGASVLRGWRNPDGSPPFVDMSAVYDPDLRALALERAAALGVEVASGAYIAMPGPNYETPAEIDALRGMGGTVVGMSVVPEATAARALGLRVLGLFSVTNLAGDPATHQEVLEMADRAARGTSALLRDLLPTLDATTEQGDDDGG
ncbi:MAG TPA: purine-nucleoside phosphorylase [Actinomycetota bacterium]|nr:purine-nucleoside phosphorylase [Actinomycetota bacterium]